MLQRLAVGQRRYFIGFGEKCSALLAILVKDDSEVFVVVEVCKNDNGINILPIVVELNGEVGARIDNLPMEFFVGSGGVH